MLIEWLINLGFREPAEFHEKKGNHMKIKFLNLGLVFCLLLGSLLTAYPTIAKTSRNDEFTPCTSDPAPDFLWSDPEVPSIFDQITFGIDGCITPDGWTCSWNFGDGTTKYPDCFVQYKQYQADNDYTVNLRISNEKGVEISDITQVVQVRTHDVGITKFTVPTSAKAGQTRQITVYVRNNRYPEEVQVELMKITPNTQYGVTGIGYTKQLVPVRSANRTTAFNFSYTFTDEDARNGKVTFKAQAFIMNLEEDNWLADDWRADNEIISFPTRVTR
jgi:hypothetical protein